VVFWSDFDWADGTLHIRGNPFQVKAAQEFYLRVSETLRRLDQAVETERRKSDEQVPKAVVQDCARQISGLLGIQQQLVAIHSGPSPTKLAEKTIDHATAKAARRLIYIHPFAAPKPAPYPDCLVQGYNRVSIVGPPGTGQ
jgi:hypothetical protein